MAHHKRTIYISDLDGTLLDENSKISSRTATILNQLIGEGMLFSIATARTPATVVDLMKDVNIQLPAILMTGALVYDIAQDKYLSVSSFPHEVASQITGAVSDCGISPMIYHIENSRLCVTYRSPLTKQQRNFIDERNGTPYKKYIEVKDALAAPDVTIMIFFMGQYEQLEKIYSTIVAIEGHCSYLYRDSMQPEQGYLEIYPCGTSKAAAIRQLANITHADEVVVFGDNINDIPMFEVAQRSYAMANAVDAAKGKATATIASNTEDGVAQFLLDEFGRNIAQ